MLWDILGVVVILLVMVLGLFFVMLGVKVGGVFMEVLGDLLERWGEFLDRRF